MPNPVGSVCRAASRGPREPLNIITFPTHERYETGLAQTGHNFFAVRGPGIKDWQRNFAPVPRNYRLLDPNQGQRQLPEYLDFDLVLSQNKFGQYSVAKQLSDQLQLPLVTLEHTLPMATWDARHMEAMRQMRGDFNVFIAAYSVKAWGWEPTDAIVIHHAIDTGCFAPRDDVHRQGYALSVVNDWKNRDWCCGYKLWTEATAGLPVKVLGDTPGLSKAAPSVPALANEYRAALVFVNTSLVSPVPMALLEAMASGCAVVSTSHCMIPEIIEHEKNGLLADTPAEIRRAVQRLLANPREAETLGRAARETIVSRFAMDVFVRQWNTLFETASGFIYRG